MTKGVEDVGIGARSNLMVLKCSIPHALSAPLKSAAFLSESTLRLIRVGTKLIVIDVSEPCMKPNFQGNSHRMEAIKSKYHGLVRFHRSGGGVYVHEWELIHRLLKVGALGVCGWAEGDDVHPRAIRKTTPLFEHPLP